MTRDIDGNIYKVEKSLDSLLKVKEREIKNAFREALRNIENELAFIYRKYSEDGSLTYAEMTKYNRLMGLETQIGKILGESDRSVKRTLKRLTADQYEQSFFGHAWAIEQGVGVSLKWGNLREEDIAAIVDNPLSLVAKDTLTMTERSAVRRSITQGLIRGESYPKMARGVKDALGKSFADALRIARTEAHRAQVEGTKAAYEKSDELGVEGRWIWVATLDGRTRTSHRSLDGKEATMRDGEHYWRLGNMWTPGPGLSGDPAEDINCRCTIRYEVDGLSPKLRRIKGEGVQPYQTYEEWL